MPLMLSLPTQSMKGEGIIKEMKKRDDVKMFVMTQSNRYSSLPEIVALIYT
jgi:hypothetical protein